MKDSIYKKELNIIKNVIDIKENSSKNIIKSPKTIEIISILEKFLKDNKLLCYGGMAINNILPPNKQFYDKNKELPDYDFFSKNALKDAKRLSDIYYKKGYDNVEAKSGLHFGTYKVYVNFLQVADITQMESSFFDKLKNKSIIVGNIYYCSPNFLRMSMYLELSRPNGDISRWEKVYNRLQLLNKYHPIDARCRLKKKNIKNDKINIAIKKVLLEFGVLFFGGLSLHAYSKYDKRLNALHDFSVFSDDISGLIYNLKEKIPTLEYSNYKSKNDYIPNYVVIKNNGIVYATIFETNACYSYNKINIDGKIYKIATIYTILSMFLTFIFVFKTNYDETKLLCLCEILIEVYKKNRLKNKGIFKNYSLKCYGTQDTFENIIIKRNNKYDDLKSNKNSIEYEKWFLKYIPSEINKNRKKKTQKKTIK